MTTVGAYEAKTHLSKLLERVRRGERITITRRGVPIAVLAPPPAEAQPMDGATQSAVRETVEALREFRRRRKGRGLTAQEIKELIEEGRRF